MKARIFAVLSILALAAWLPLRAQQSAGSTQTPQTPAPAADPANAAKHDCCRAAKPDASQSATGHDPSAMDCCHGKKDGDAKASCCAAKDGKEMSCCAQKSEASKSAMDCCKDMKDGKCDMKDGKSCCAKTHQTHPTHCCAGMSDHCPAHAS